MSIYKTFCFLKSNDTISEVDMVLTFKDKDISSVAEEYQVEKECLILIEEKDIPVWDKEKNACWYNRQSKTFNIVEVESQPTQLDRIEKIVTEKNEELKKEGEEKLAKIAAAALSLTEEKPVYLGLFKAAYPEWVADGETEETGHVSVYNGIVYQCNVTIQRIPEYAPDKATNNYNPYPTPDEKGIYSYVYGMGVIKGMLIRDDGIVYRCVLETDKPYKLVYPPKDVPALFEVTEW